MNQNIHKILACVDFSSYSPMVLEYAVALAQGTDTQILVFNVINQRDISGAEMVFSYYPGSFTNVINTDDYIRDLKNERSEKLKQMILDKINELISTLDQSLTKIEKAKFIVNEINALIPQRPVSVVADYRTGDCRGYY